MGDIVGGGGWGGSYHRSPQPRREKTEFKEFDELAKLIESKELKDKRINPKGTKTKNRILLTYCNDCTHGTKKGTIHRSEEIICVGKAKKFGSDKPRYKELIILNRERKEIDSFYNMENTIDAGHKTMMEVDEEVYNHFWEDFFGKPAKKDELQYSTNHKEKIEKFIQTLAEYLKGEFYKPARMLLRGDQELPAKLAELEEKISAEEFLKTKKGLELAFKDQIEQEINNDEELKKHVEKLSFAKACGLDAEEATQKIKDYKKRVKQKYSKKIREIERLLEKV